MKSTLIAAFLLCVLPAAPSTSAQSAHLPTDRTCEDLSVELSADTLLNIDCEAAAHVLTHVPEQAPLEVIRKFWDPAGKRWNLIVRCRQAGDCIPFMLRLRPGEAPPPLAAPASRPRAAVQAPDVSQRFADARRLTPDARSADTQALLVRRGEKATLVWDQDGIRVLVSAICMDAGIEGQSIRARMVRSGRMVRATVIGIAKIRAQL